MATQENEATAPVTPHSTALGNLYAAKAEFSALATEAGRTPEGRCYHIVVTDLEKLIFVAEGYFRPSPDASNEGTP
jgi:hypothetical protein